MEDTISQGYGSPDQLMGVGPSDAELAQQGDPMTEDGQGGDVEAMITEGVQAFLESNDPEVAVQVVMMLAETMGLTGGADPGPAAAPAGPPAGGTPMAKNGGKFGFFGNEDRAGAFKKFVYTK